MLHEGNSKPYDMAELINCIADEDSFDEFKADYGKTMLAARKGHFFNICSVAALNPVVAAGSYSVTKYALLGLTKVMRLEMQDHGVKVTAIIPGSTLTDSWKDVQVDKNSMVLPEDIASALINIYNMSAGANVDEIIIKPVKGQL